MHSSLSLLFALNILELFTGALFVVVLHLSIVVVIVVASTLCSSLDWGVSLDQKTITRNPVLIKQTLIEELRSVVNLV